MVRVSVEVRSGDARFRIRIRASDIQRAVSLAEGLYPTSDVRVVFPIKPEDFFVEDFFIDEGLVGRDMPLEELVA